MRSPAALWPHAHHFSSETLSPLSYLPFLWLPQNYHKQVQKRKKGEEAIWCSLSFLNFLSAPVLSCKSNALLIDTLSLYHRRELRITRIPASFFLEEIMNLSVNGQSQIPPGFRFHPTEEELLHYYLRKKVACERIDLDVIRDVDLNKLEPWDIQEKCRIGSTPQNDWYFFSHKDKKYPTGTRTNRATAAGFWKATGRDKVIYASFKRIGMRKTLVFYKGRAPHGQKSDWIMHEYRLDDESDNTSQFNPASTGGDSAQEDGWVVCRIFKKKNLLKAVDSPKNSSSVPSETTAQMLHSSNSDGALDQILQYMGRACKQENESNNGVRFLRQNDKSASHERFMQLLPQESPTTLPSTQSCYTPDVQIMADTDGSITTHGSPGFNPLFNIETGHLSDWNTLDRLVASHLNGQAETSKHLSGFNNPSHFFWSVSDSDLPLPSYLHSSNRSFTGSNDNGNNNDMDLWSFARSAYTSTDHFPMYQTPLPN